MCYFFLRLTITMVKKRGRPTDCDVYMFYDCLCDDDGKLVPEVYLHCDYDASWRELVGEAIVD